MRIVFRASRSPYMGASRGYGYQKGGLRAAVPYTYLNRRTQPLLFCPFLSHSLVCFCQATDHLVLTDSPREIDKIVTPCLSSTIHLVIPFTFLLGSLAAAAPPIQRAQISIGVTQTVV